MEWLQPAVISALSAAAGALIFAFVRARVRWAVGVADAEHRVETQRADRATRARSDAIEEAWVINKHQQGIIDRLEGKIDMLEQRHEVEQQECEEERRRCLVEHAQLRGRVSIIEAWAMSKGLKIPREVGSDNTGSKEHGILPEPPASP